MENWFISDTHFHHENIIGFSSRPFSNVQEMDEYMIQEWNRLVKDSDHISHLGDVTMERGGRVQQNKFIQMCKRLHGHKRLYLGNHDHFSVRTYLEAGFEKIYATHRGDVGIVFSHFPLHPNSMGSAIANVHGHTHTSPDEKPVVWVDKDQKLVIKPYINISVEKTEYRPITLGEVVERIKKARELNG